MNYKRLEKELTNFFNVYDIALLDYISDTVHDIIVMVKECEKDSEAEGRDE